ncbi:hypothetical protein [uncultured Corynebacterium sp.]|uniref:hypothetical protein n=1 Tax=uncultured Corynebacterium sp. TaxID=159447 RepID=UPI0025F674C8|nr:hypothetical protein [uncultured Corynebacterium sp.]
MHDPTRIDRVLAALRDAWEGQPDLSLPTLFGVASNHGAGWGADDSQLLAVLRDMARIHPPLFPPRSLADARRVSPGQVFSLELSDSVARITVDAASVLVRGFRMRPGRKDAEPVQPVVWEYSGIRPTGPGRPLVIADAEGIEHRLGIVRSITLLDAPPAERLPELVRGLRKRDIGEYAFVIRTPDTTVVLDHRAHVFAKSRRALRTETHPWERVEAFRPGETLIIRTPDGGRLEFGAVESIHLAQAPAMALGN